MNERCNDDDVCLAHSSDRIRRVCQQIEMKMIAQSCEKSKDRDNHDMNLQSRTSFLCSSYLQLTFSIQHVYVHNVIYVNDPYWTL